MSYYRAEMLEQLIVSLSELREQVWEMERAFATEVTAVAERYRASARNLLHYLGLRQHDLRELQHMLTALGLSSLGRSEEYALADLDAVLFDLQRIAGIAANAPAEEPPVDFVSGPALLEQHTQELLGQAPPGRVVRIMVTMPTEAGREYQLVYDLVVAGMDIMRINCAHARSEVTDAAMSERADVVMLNKGSHVVAAVRFLSDVLQRMQLHQEKKRALLRRLSISNIA